MYHLMSFKPSIDKTRCKPFVELRYLHNLTNFSKSCTEGLWTLPYNTLIVSCMPGLDCFTMKIPFPTQVWKASRPFSFNNLLSLRLNKLLSAGVATVASFQSSQDVHLSRPQRVSNDSHAISLFPRNSTPSREMYVSCHVIPSPSSVLQRWNPTRCENHHSPFFDVRRQYIVHVESNRVLFTIDNSVANTGIIRVKFKSYSLQLTGKLVVPE